MKRETKTYWIDIQGKINNRLDAWETDLGAVARPRVLVPESLHEEFENEWTLGDALAYGFIGEERSLEQLTTNEFLANILGCSKKEFEKRYVDSEVNIVFKVGSVAVSKDNLSKEKIFQNGASKYIIYYPKIPKAQLNFEFVVYMEG